MVAAGTTKHEMICCIQECCHAKDRLNWTTRDKLFDDMLDILLDPADWSCWELPMGRIPNCQDVAQFKIFIEECIQHKFSNDTTEHDDHKMFLQHGTKPHDFTAHKCVQLLQCHNMSILPWLPGIQANNTAPSLDDHAVKQTTHNAMPTYWQDSCFQLFTMTDHDSHHLVNFMEK